MNSISKKPEYSIVIPVYNSGSWLSELVDRIAKTMRLQDCLWELILVNDHSPEIDTWDKIVELANKFPEIKGIDLLYNTGQFRATLCGFEHAQGKYIITIDDDLQHPPEEIPKLINAVQAHPEMDCIMGEYQQKQHSYIRNYGSAFIGNLMRRLYGKPKGIVTTSFRLMNSDFARSLTLYRIAHPQLGPLTVHLSKKIMNVPVTHNQRPHGTSGYRMGKLIWEAWRSVTNASLAPLRWISAVGAITSLLSFLFGTVIVIRRLHGGIKVPGYTSLMVFITGFSGLILLGIGILGEYLGRAIDEITGMPRFFIKEIICGKKPNE